MLCSPWCVCIVDRTGQRWFSEGVLQRGVDQRTSRASLLVSDSTLPLDLDSTICWYLMKSCWAIFQQFFMAHGSSVHQPTSWAPETVLPWPHSVLLFTWSTPGKSQHQWWCFLQLRCCNLRHLRELCAVLNVAWLQRPIATAPARNSSA